MLQVTALLFSRVLLVVFAGIDMTSLRLTTVLAPPRTASTPSKYTLAFAAPPLPPPPPPPSPLLCLCDAREYLVYYVYYLRTYHFFFGFSGAVVFFLGVIIVVVVVCLVAHLGRRLPQHRRTRSP